MILLVASIILVDKTNNVLLVLGSNLSYDSILDVLDT